MLISLVNLLSGDFWLRRVRVKFTWRTGVLKCEPFESWRKKVERHKWQIFLSVATTRVQDLLGVTLRLRQIWEQDAGEAEVFEREAVAAATVAQGSHWIGATQRKGRKTESGGHVSAPNRVEPNHPNPHSVHSCGLRSWGSKRKRACGHWGV